MDDGLLWNASHQRSGVKVRVSDCCRPQQKRPELPELMDTAEDADDYGEYGSDNPHDVVQILRRRPMIISRRENAGGELSFLCSV